MKEFDPIASLFLARVLTDASSGHCDLAYAMAETKDNQVCALQSAALLYHGNCVGRVAITGLGQKYGYIGGEAATMYLLGFGVELPDIVCIDPVEPSNTFAEAQQLVSYMTQKALHSVAVVAPTFHLPRSFLSVVSAVIQTKSSIRVYPSVGVPLAWEENVVHSQGVTTGSRADIFQGELQRIVRYHEKGDLVSLEEALEYMRERDRAVS